MLELESLAAGLPEQLTALNRRNAPVRWVHISDELDIADYLHGREALLSTGMHLDELSAAHTSTYVRALVDRDVSALILCPAEDWTVPDTLLDAAELSGLPIVRLHRRVNFSEVTEEVHDAVLGHRLRWMIRTEALRQELAALAMAPTGTTDLVARLSQITNRPVVLEGRHGEVIEAASPVRNRAAQHEWTLGHRALHTEGGSGIQTTAGCTWCPIDLDGRRWATVHVLGARPAPSDDLRTALEAIVPALQVRAVLTSDDAALRSRSHDRFVASVIDGSLQGAHDTRQELRLQNALRAERVVTYCLMIDTANADEHSDRDQSPLVDWARRRLADFFSGDTTHLLTGQYRGGLIGFVSATTKTQLREAFLHVGEEILKSAGAAVRNETLRVRVGLSSPSDLGGLKAAVDESWSALRFSAPLAAVEVHDFEDFRLHHLLSGIPRGELVRFVRTELGALLDGDAARSTDLVRTLEVYLASSRQATATARSLFIERRTLYHRLKAIERVLGRPLSAPTTADALGLALAARRVIASPDLARSV